RRTGIAGRTNLNRAERTSVSLPRRVQLRRRDSSTTRDATDDQNLIVVRKKGRDVILTGGTQSAADRAECVGCRIEYFRRSQDAVRVGTADDQDLSVEERRRRQTGTSNRQRRAS